MKYAPQHFMKNMKPKIVQILFLLLSFTNLFAQPEDFEKVTIVRNEINLDGRIFPVDGEGPFAVVMLLNGFPGNDRDVLGLGKKLKEAGIVSLTFNYSGTYGSGGEYSMEYTPIDIEAAFKFLLSPSSIKTYKLDTTNITLGGYSYGGGMSLTYAAKKPEIKRIFSIAGTDHGEFFREYFRNEGFASFIDGMFENLKAPNGSVNFEKGKMPKEITPEQVAQLDSTIDLRKSVPLLLDRQVLLIAGLDDSMVTMENHMLPLYRSFQIQNANDVKFVVFQDDHSFQQSREEIAELLINWIKK